MFIKIFSIFKLLVILIFFSFPSFSEPFVVLEYRGKTQDIINSSNQFLSDKNFSTKHKVRKNETLTDIILKYYGFKNFNRDILSFSIVHFNKHAFVRKNPNFLFANKTLYLPSLKQIQNLVIKLPKKENDEDFDTERSSQIYFFGG